MLNYIGAELSKTFKRRYFWTTIIIVLSCAVIGCWGFIYMNHRGMNAEPLALEHVIEVGIGMFSAATYMLIIFTDMITLEEFKNNTIKNIISSGMSRVKIYLSKNIEVVLMSLVGMLIILGGSIVIGYIMLGIGSAQTIMMEFEILGVRLLGTVFLWMGAASMLHFIATFIKNGTATSLIYVCLLLLLPNVLSVLGHYINPIFNSLNRVWLGTQLNVITLGQISSAATIEAIVVGLAYVIIFSVMGCVLIRKADM